MIVAGIDEAGYGALLGALVVGCCAFEVDKPPQRDGLPRLWKRLTKRVSRNRTKTGKKLHVNDSKQVYSPAFGLKELERSILCIMLASGLKHERFADLLAFVSPEAQSDLAHHPWYTRPAEE